MIKPNWAMKLRTEDNKELVLYLGFLIDEEDESIDEPVLYFQNENLNDEICATVLSESEFCDCTEYAHFMPFITSVIIEDGRVTLGLTLFRDILEINDYGEINFLNVEDANDATYCTAVIKFEKITDITIKKGILLEFLNDGFIEAEPEVLQKYSLFPDLAVIGKDTDGEYRALRYIDRKSDKY